MKKNSVLKPVIFAIIGLVAGVLIGMSINGFPPRDNELAGSIGKVDNKRNVRITEEDVLLRNDLAEDTVKLLQYQRYLSYIYYKSLKSTTDVERVINLTVDNEAFVESLNLTQTLEGYLTYLNTARADLISALHALENPEMDNKTPIIQYLNDAQNAAARIQSNEGVFLTYLDGVEAWLATHPDQNNKKLKEAHDILAFNIMQNALLAQDKPLLSYLKDKKMLCDNQTLYAVLNDTIQRDNLLAFIEKDNIGVSNFNAQSSDKIIKSIEQLNAINDHIGSAISLLVILNDADAINSAEILGTGFTDQQKLQAINDQQALGAINDQQKLGAINDQQKLGAFFSDQQKLQAINDQQKLNSLLNKESLQAIFNQQKLGATLGDNLTLGAIIFNMQALGASVNDQQKLGVFNNQQSLGGFYLNQQSLGSIMNDLQAINSQALGRVMENIN